MIDNKIENVAGALALAISDDLLRAAEAEAPEPGQAAAAIALLAHAPRMPIEKLRRALGLSHPGTVRLIDRLEKQGLVLRGPSDVDGRAVALTLTREGKKRCRAILRARKGVLERAMQSLTPAEKTLFGRLADKLLRAVLRSEDHAWAMCRLCDDGICTECPVEAELRIRDRGACEPH